MATVKRVSTAIPSRERSFLISDVVAGDKIDILYILGRPARTVKFVMGGPSDTVEYRLNNLLRLRKFNETVADETVEVWSGSDSFPVYSDSGKEAHVSLEPLEISSLEIVNLTLAGGTTIEIVVV